MAFLLLNLIWSSIFHKNGLRVALANLFPLGRTLGYAILPANAAGRRFDWLVTLGVCRDLSSLCPFVLPFTTRLWRGNGKHQWAVRAQRGRNLRFQAESTAGG